jgi:hypothetical protein
VGTAEPLFNRPDPMTRVKLNRGTCPVLTNYPGTLAVVPSDPLANLKHVPQASLHENTSNSGVNESIKTFYLCHIISFISN